MEGIIDDTLWKQKEAVLKSTLDWKTFKGTYLTDTQLSLLTSYNNARSVEARSEMLVQDGPDIAELFLSLLDQVKQTKYLKYLLVLLDEIVSDMRGGDRLEDFINLSFDNSEWPCAPLVDILTNNDDYYLQFMAAKIVSVFLFSLPANQSRKQDIDSVLRWVVKKLDSKDNNGVRAAMKSLQYLLQKDELRIEFDALSGLDLLAPVLTKQHRAVVNNKGESGEKDVSSDDIRDLQLIYETVFCVWLMSFNDDISQKRFHGKHIILDIVRLCQHVEKEKVRRVALSTLRNLSGKGDNDEQMIYAGLHKVVRLLAAKKWGDQDIVNDLEFLEESLEQTLIDMTTFDKYKQEVLSGTLEWSPVHKSDKFWKENVEMFGENEYELVGMLSALLASEETSNISIACHDLGEFSRFHPRGKKLIHQHNIKSKIMQLIDHKDPQVSQQSLLALQKIMITNWEYIATN